MQAPQTDIVRHEVTYRVGWDAIRERRLLRMKSLGLVAGDVALLPRSADVSDWELLPPDEQQRGARIMATYAAMVELMDRNLGRVLHALEQTGTLDNTVVLFLSDNGPDARDISGYPFYATWLRQNFETDAPTGNADSFLFAGPGWGQVSATPYRGAKSSLNEGGIRSPLIVTDFRRRSAATRRVSAFTTVKDVVPTILALLPGSVDLSRYDRAVVYRPEGRPMLAVMSGEQTTVHPDGEPVGYEYAGHAALFEGQWKALRKNGAAEVGNWELYDLDADPTESTDLASTNPDRIARMALAFDSYAAEVGVVSAH